MDIQILKSLIEKVKIAEEVYSRAAHKIHSEEMGKAIMNMHKDLTDLREKLMADNNLKQDDIHIDIVDQLKIGLEKLGLEIDSVLIRLNQKETMGFCMKREDEINTAFKTLLNTKAISEKEKKEFKILKQDSDKRMKYFKNIQNAYLENYAS